ncbi:hypothetical protein AB0E25_41555 [Streptomyces bobili]|uniref:hypothetical protein n=1 Tax=Streptomyces bobili TaxID=67280 RepID=UPI0033C4787C
MAIDVPLSAVTDPAAGGRWTSLHGGGREWLWHRPDLARFTVRPGDAFVDAGGIEECVPTVRGVPDHGDAWSRRWTRADGGDELRHPDFVLRRSLRSAPRALTASYVLSAAPGYRLIWTAHALLDLTEAARIRAPEGTFTRLFPDSAPLLDRPWPDEAPHVSGAWPAPYALRLDHFGPDDGTAVAAVLTDCPKVTVADGADRLTFTLRTEEDVPVSVALWRNLGGYPRTGTPYRSIGVEPMLGSVLDLDRAAPGEAAVVPAGGELRWELDISMTRAE